MTIALPLAALTIFLADQLTKAWIAEHLPKNRSRVLLGVLQFRYSENFFGRPFSTHRRASLPLWWLAAALGLFALMQFGNFFRDPAAQLGIGAALGGSGSNVYDWHIRGAVIDFVKLGWWPVFNLADVAISLGAVLALWFMR